MRMGNGGVAPCILHHSLDRDEYSDRNPGHLNIEKASVSTGYRALLVLTCSLDTLKTNFLPLSVFNFLSFTP
jgi:hypothetical protein